MLPSQLNFAVLNLALLLPNNGSSAVEEAKTLLTKILGKGPVAVRMAKKAIQEGLDLSLESGQKTEIQCQQICFGTEDKDEGARAFLEKRAPNFKGK